MANALEVKPKGAVMNNKVNSFILDDFDEVGESISVNGQKTEVYLRPPGQFEFDFFITESDHFLEVQWDDNYLNYEIEKYPLFLSIIPPLLAIILAFLFKDVLISLFIGVISGSAIFSFYQKGIWEAALAPLSAITSFILPAAADPDHMSIIIFSMLIAGMVEVIRKNGAMNAMVQKIAIIANTRQKTQLAGFLMGIAVFFDDYANTLVVGNTMRSVADKMKISREKLAYLVDSTAAPVASIALITTWIGSQLSYIQSGISTLPEITDSPYLLLLRSIPFSFYPLLTLAFILILIWQQKDFGPMYKAEKKALELNKLAKDENYGNKTPSNQSHWLLALIPILVLLSITAIGLWYTGTSSFQNSHLSINEIIGQSDVFKALLWGSLGGYLTSFILSLFNKSTKLELITDATLDGFKSMIQSIVILILAWALAQITVDLHTAEFLTSTLKKNIHPFFIPSIVFVVAAITAFATGSSWGTMAILYPIIIPLCWELGSNLPENELMRLLLISISVVLTGSVLGDHCSPISDTTILSSMATDCNHISHVETQMPYAITVGIVALILGILPASFGVSLLILYPLGLIALWLFVQKFGKQL